MARLFDDANTQYLEYDGGLISDVPITLAGWFNTDNNTGVSAIISMCHNASDTSRITLISAGTVGGDPVSLFVQNGGSSTLVSSTTGYSLNTWHHACGIKAANDSHAAYIDGGSKGTNATSVIFPTVNKTAIGRDSMLAPANYMSGMIAEVGMWNVALTDEEVAILAKGYSPLLVRPQSLVGYWPLIGRTSPEIDLVGGAGMTLAGGTGTPIVAVHPRMLYSARVHQGIAAAGSVIGQHSWGVIF